MSKSESKSKSKSLGEKEASSEVVDSATQNERRRWLVIEKDELFEIHERGDESPLGIANDRAKAERVAGLLNAADEYQRALTAIDLVVSDDFCEELDMANMHRKLRGRIATAREKLSTTYMIAHSEVPTHSCHHVHEDWRQIKDRILTAEEQFRTQSVPDGSKRSNASGASSK